MTSTVRLALVFSVAAVVHPVALPASRPTAPPKASFAQPGISPDGQEIAFVSAGDIWAVPAAGGEARLLVSHPANEERPLYSPDGSQLAFVSNRAGNADIWVLTFATGDLRRVTADDSAEHLDAWSPDGAWLYFTSNVQEGLNVYRVRSTGGTPMLIAGDRDAVESMAAPAPDGEAIVVAARGNVFGWWRRGRSHFEESELWLVRFGASGAPHYEVVVGPGAKQQWPMYSADGRALYFVSDRSGEQNLWMKPGGGEARAVTSFTSGRVLWPTISRQGRIAFERDFGIWVFDAAAQRSREIPITLRGAAVVEAPEYVSPTSYSDLAVSSDGKKVAFVARGEVFAASSAQGGDAVRVTRTPAAEEQITWSSDSRRIAYSANRTGTWQIYTYDFTSGTETALTDGPTNATHPTYSPDGKSLAFIRAATELCVLSLDDRTPRVAARGYFGRPPNMAERPIAWSPDNRWIAYLSAGAKLFQNVWVVPVDAGGEPRQLTWLADTLSWPYLGTLSWSPDGSFLLFNSGARLEPGALYRLDLTPSAPRFREDQFESLFRDAPRPPAAPAPGADRVQARPTNSPEAPRPVQIDFEGIRQRLSPLPLGLDVGPHTLAPDGKMVVVRATVAGQQNLYSYSLDDLAAERPVARQVTATAPAKASVGFAGDGKSIWYLEGGRITTTVFEPRATRPLGVRAALSVDFAAEKWEVFHQAWEYLNDNFYDERFHGVDWPAVREVYAPRIAGARTRGELHRLLLLMMGELNASHTGVNPPRADGAGPTVGRLGIDWDRQAYETRGEFVVAGLVPLGPAALTGQFRLGDRVLEIDGGPVNAATNLSERLKHTVGRKVSLTVLTAGTSNERRSISVRPVLWFDENGLRYRAWVEQRRALVKRLSHGRLGYVHIPDMGASAPAELALALDAENQAADGIVLDARNNGGGFTNGHVLDMLMRKPYIDMVLRDVPPVSARYILGQRAVHVPTILVTNKASVSDAENFTEGYRVLGLGRVVGERTAGADIFTTAATLVDGSTVRIPYMRNAQLDQKALELNPRPVDVAVAGVPGESYSGRDAQLEAAVRELLSQLSGKPRSQ